MIKVYLVLDCNGEDHYSVARCYANKKDAELALSSPVFNSGSSWLDACVEEIEVESFFDVNKEIKKVEELLKINEKYMTTFDKRRFEEYLNSKNELQ